MLIHAYNWFKFLFLILGLVNRLKLTPVMPHEESTACYKEAKLKNKVSG